MSVNDERIQVLSLNCWGLKYVARHRTERIRAIADELSRSTYDIIALQEIWVFADYEIVRVKVSKKLPFAKFFYSGALGSGLAIFSRFPILETSTFPYSLNGSPIDVAAGDWIVGKGVVSIVISHPILHEIEVFNTHFNAQGGDEGPEVQRVHRIVGAWEFSKRIRQSAALGRHIIATGDYNSIPSSLVMSIIREHGGLTDAWIATHFTSFLPPADAVHSPHHAVQDFGVTADSPLNTYSAAKHLSPIAKRWQGKRLDYIFYRGPITHRRLASYDNDYEQPRTNGVHADPYLPSLDCEESKVVMTGKVPGHDFSFSDHFGVEATLAVRFPSTTAPLRSTPTPPPAAPPVWETPLTARYLDNGSPHSNAAPSPSPYVQTNATTPRENPQLSQQTLTLILQALSAAYRASRLRARQHFTVFGLCILGIVALVIGSAWQPVPGANPVLILAAVALAWLGTTMLYSAFIHGKWEVNALMTVVEELELLNNINQRSGRGSTSRQSS